MADIQEKKNQKLEEIELESNQNSQDYEEGHIHEVFDNENAQIIQKQAQSNATKKLFLFGILTVGISAILIGILYYYFFIMNQKQQYKYNGQLVEECPSITLLLNQECYDQCPEKTIQRGRQCVEACYESDYFYNNKCIITSCRENSSKNSSFYDFSSGVCVQKCSSTSFIAFGEFCFDRGCPKEEILTLMKQYIDKRSKNLISQKPYDSIANNLKVDLINEIIITSDISNQVCNIGCSIAEKSFIYYNETIGRYQCQSTCLDFNFIYKKNDQTICLEQCPPNTFISAISNECVETCGMYMIYNNKCVRTCPNGLLKEGNTCVNQCSQENPFIYKENNCVKNCNADPSLPYILNGKCVSYCSQFIKFVENGQECTNSCDLLASNLKTCADKCNKNEIEVTLKGQRQCFAIQTCPVSYQFFNPDIGCKEYCSISYPYKFKTQCISKCFDNWSVHDNQCLEICPQSIRYSEEGQCVTQCSDPYYAYEYKCYTKCPNEYFQNQQNKQCTPTCEGYQVLPERNCYQACPSQNPFYHQKECVKQCPSSNFIYQDQNNHQNCVLECPVFTYSTPDRQCVKECPINLFKMKEMRQCVSSCPNTYDEDRVCQSKCNSSQRFIIGSDECFSTCPQTHSKVEGANECISNCNQLIYKPQDGGENLCVRKCETIQKYESKGQCIDQCPRYHFNSICLDTCPYTYPLSEDKKCVAQCSTGKILYEKQCLDKCPDNLYFVESSQSCAEACPQQQFILLDEKICKNKCDDFLLDLHYCVKSCPKNTILIGNRCQLNNSNNPGKYFDIFGNLIDTCDTENGYYTQERVCRKCEGGEGCKKCSQLYGLCLECKEPNVLYQNQCVPSCPVSFTPKQGICIKDSEFLKKNLFFREYTASNFINSDQKVKYSILEDIDYINNENDQDDDSQLKPTVIVHLHDLNSTYLDFYSYPFYRQTEERQTEFIDNLELAVIKQGISIITVQSPDVIFLDNFFNLALDEILPSLGYFKANVVFSGVGLAANSIVKSVSQILSNQNQDEMSRVIFGNYIVDMQYVLQDDPFVKELSLQQFSEFKNYLTSKDNIQNNLDTYCQIYYPFLRLKDIVYVQRSGSEQQTLTDYLAYQESMYKCPSIQVRPQNMLIDFYSEKEKNSLNRYTVNYSEYGSEERKVIIYREISQDLLSEVANWINNESSQQNNKD